MTTSVIIAIIGSILTVFSVGIAFLTFWFTRRKDSLDVGEWKGELKSDLNHIKNGVDELRHDTKDIKDDVQTLRERVVLVENSVKSAHHRIDELQRKENKDAD